MDERTQDLANGLRGRYTIERQLGHGGMATVWLARDLRYDRLVALKVLRPELAASLGGDRFLREIMLAARLQHPHVVSVYDSGEIPTAPPGDPILWFTMPYIEGESLRERLRRVGALPREDALRIARDVSRGLHYAHQHGVVHRDVKPENILLTADGSTLVADFGIARPTDAQPAELTGTGIVIGTPAYMSPEQASGVGDLDARTDLYALACVVYEMLTGVPPFTGATVHAIVAKHLTEQPSLSGGVAGPIPESIRPVLARALAKDPRDRQASVAEFAAALGVADRRPRAAPARTALVATAALIAAAGDRAVPRAGRCNRLTRRERSRGARGLGRLGVLAQAGAAQLRRGARGMAGVVAGREDAGVRRGSRWIPPALHPPRPGGPERQLTRGPRDHIMPAWSPDGTRLAFVHSAGSTGKLEPSEVDGAYFEGGELWTMDLATGQETKLFDNGFNPSWSPDGQRLAFDAPLTGGQRVWVADVRGRNPRQVTSDSSEVVVHTQPRWSPDGSKLVFRRIEKLQSDIAVADFESQRIVHVTDDFIPDQDPAWSPDGRSIYFSSSRGGGINIWRMPVAADGAPNGPAEQLTTGAGDDVQPSLHPDGRRLVFAVRGINADLWRLPVSPATGRATGAPEPILSTTRVESRGSWSPDGRSIAFNSDRTGEMNIWIRDPAGDERQITFGSGGDYQPTWSPDGKSVVFFSARGGNTDIWLGQPRRHDAHSAHRRSRARHQPLLLTRRPADRIRLRPERPLRSVDHERGRQRGTAARLGGMLGTFHDLDSRQPRDRVSRRARAPAADLPGGRRGRPADADAGGVERRAHVVLAGAGAHPRCQLAQAAQGAPGGRPAFLPDLPVRRSRCPDRLPPMVARWPLGAVRPDGPAGRGSLVARGLLISD